MDPQRFDRWSLEQARELAGLYVQAHKNLSREIEARLRRVLEGEELSAKAMLRLRSLLKHIEAELERLTAQAEGQIRPLLDEAEELTREEIAAMAREPQWNLFEGSAAAEYVRQGTLLEQNMASTLKGYSADLLAKVKRILNLAVMERRSWNHTARLIQRAFGDAGRPLGRRLGYYGSTGAAAQAARLVVTELARARSLGHQHHIKHDPDIIGVIIHHGAGPCRTGVCPRRAGRYMGKDNALAELRRIPRHPWCRCWPEYIYENLNFDELARELAA
ncbi:MAG: hypothetical protein K9K66_07620 [Desulfarculaceae bacterium]|nr:hypothetical protein [Desulfarculaceae bacterium]MCF8071993.1 hypothetical protein [Desulfarculaceae bacterium]MCF8101510.1 hypothetical protein [Desulfarculaceae bacterium]MCF8115060.1 hypothetical protein [Desulfarculaceae bacterium]